MTAARRVNPTSFKLCVGQKHRVLLSNQKKLQILETELPKREKSM
jgi:hypothetical protein